MDSDVNYFVGSGAFGFFVGFIIGYAIKKLMRILAIVIGLFLGGVTYLQYQGIVNVNWDKVDATSRNTISDIVKAITQYPALSDHITNVNTTTAMANLVGLPLTGGMAIGFAIGFMKG
jgi:uncharacterized membrane protein (Fun14 family)